MSILNEYMDKTELAIANISGADLLKYYTMPDGVTGLIIIKDSTVFNLSSGEKHFDSLEQAAVRAYAACSDAAADDLTREILTERSGAEISPICRQYEGIDGVYEKTLPFEKDTVGAFRQMMEYYLEMIYEKLGYGTLFPSELKGYRRKYSLSFRLNSERKTLPLSYIESGSCFEMVFGNVMEASDIIKLSVKYTFGMISVTANVKCKKHMRIENTFDMLHKRETLRIFNETEIVYNGTQSIASSPSNFPEESKMLFTCDGYEMMRLPFGDVYIIDMDNRSEMIVSQKNQSAGTSFLYQSQREYLSGDRNIVTDSMNAVHKLFWSDGKMNICTRFIPTASFSKGIYKQKYENRYFYRSFDDIGGKKYGG